MKSWQNQNTSQEKVSHKGFHFRLADEPIALQLSGFEFNAVTPFFMAEDGAKLPIILSDRIA